MSTTTKREGGFSVTTLIKAPVEAVYRAWTQKAGMEGWLASEATVDARAGGKYVLEFGGGLSARGSFLELVENQRVVLTWESWGPNGRMEDGDAAVTVDLKDLGDGTTEMTQSETSPTYDDEARREMSIRGTIQAHEGLAAFVESGFVESGGAAG